MNPTPDLEKLDTFTLYRADGSVTAHILEATYAEHVFEVTEDEAYKWKGLLGKPPKEYKNP